MIVYYRGWFTYKKNSPRVSHVCSHVVFLYNLESIPMYLRVFYYLYVEQSPPKGVTIPYRPKPSQGSPVIFAGGQVGYYCFTAV